MRDYEIVTLVDGRRGYFYHTRFTGTYWFQPVDKDNCALGPVEMPDEEHVVAEASADLEANNA